MIEMETSTWSGSELMLPKASSSERPRAEISWSDVRFKIKAPKGVVGDADGFLELIHGVSGFANPGQVLAIMGGSGAGKTTLLNILSDRLANPKRTRISGTVLANGQSVKDIAYKTYIGYVMQDDILLDTMTPRECIQFSADMRVHGSPEEKKAKVDALLEDLKLTSVADNRVGSEQFKGISGGEKRRTSIGVELITDPSAIFLDVMGVLNNLAKGGMTVICTIHQPSSDIFALFDRLMLLSEGNVVYQGPASGSRSYFDSINYQCPKLVNPADHYMKILHIVDRNHMTEEESKRLTYFVTSYKLHIDTLSSDRNTGELSILSKNDFHYHPPYQKQISILLKRSNRNTYRNPVITQVRLAQLFTTLLMIVLVYNDLGDGEDGIQNRSGALYFIVTSLFMLGLQSSILSCKVYAVPIERSLFLKEQGMAMYGVSSYFQAKNLAELPIQVFPPLVFFVVVYFALQLNQSSPDKFFIFSEVYSGLAMLLLHLSGSSIGLLIGSGFSNVRVALNGGSVRVMQIMVIPLMLFGGFFSNQHSIPEAWVWISYVSVSSKQPFRYAFEAVAINEFTDLHLTCEHANPPCDPLKTLDFGEGLWTSIFVLIAITIGIRIMSFLLLKFLVRKLGS